MLAVVWLWAWTDLADRIRTGDVVADLLRPVDPVTSYLAADLGRAGHALLTRLIPPMVVGPLFFPVVPAAAVADRTRCSLLSVVLATLICFGCRYLVNASGYWLLDIRGR